MAFEVYYRKSNKFSLGLVLNGYLSIVFADKVLLMLQSLKRAHKVNPKDPKLHSCLIRFNEVVVKNKGSWEESLEEVITKETKAYFDGKHAKQLNKDFLASNSTSLCCVFEGAKMMYRLDNKCQSQALKLVTSLDNKYTDVNIEVSGVLRIWRCNKLYIFFSFLL